MDVDVSLDNVSLVGEWHTWGDVCEFLEDARTADPQKVRSTVGLALSTATSRHQQAWVIDGAYLSCWVEFSPLGRNWMLADLDGKPRGRVEFNPNKLTPRVASLIQIFETDHVTRCDVALDYLGLDVRDAWFSRPRVKSAYHVGPGGVESLYLGSRGSDRCVRVYDKALEQKRDDLTLTRIEGLGRKHNVLAENLFDGVQARYREIPLGTTPRTAGAIACYLHYPEVCREWDKKTRAKVKQMVEAATQPIGPSPEVVYRDSLSQLDDMLGAVQAGELVRIAKVYQEVSEGD